MPEFILDKAGTVNGVAFDDLCAFTQGYVEAMFFTEVSCISMTEWHTEEAQERVREGQADGTIPQDAGWGDIHPESGERIQKDCFNFEANNARLLEAAYALEPGSAEFRYAKEPLDKRRAGQLFWYARNGHGVGWDDDGDAECLSALQEASQKVGNCDLWFSEQEESDSPTGYGWVYLT